MLLAELFRKNITSYLVLVLIAAIYFSFLPQGAMTLLGVVLYLTILFTMNNTTRGIALILFASPIIGLLFSVFNISLSPYIIFSLIGVILIRNHKRLFLYHRNLFIKFFLIIVFFFFFFLAGPMHDYSLEKILYISIIGFNSLLAWLVFVNSDEIEHFKLTQFLISISILFIAVAFEFSSYNRPASFMDFNFFRNSLKQARLEDSLAISYHSVGMAAMYGLTFIIGSKDFKTKGKNLFLVLISILLLFISGARQALLGGALLILYSVFINNSNTSGFRKLLGVLILATLMYVIFLNINISAIDNSLGASSLSSSLNRDYSRAIDYIKSYPLWGRGLGGYSLTGERGYPHNIFLELLSETGVIGTLLISSFLIIHLKVKNFSFYHVTKSNFSFSVLVLALLIRALVSSDLIENIVLITLLLAFSSKYQKKIG